MAQADFRANDRDGNGVRDYWRADVSGLYTVKTGGVGIPNKLIDLSLAAADAQPVSAVAEYANPGPKNSCWFRAIPHEGETTPDPDRFAFCAYPAIRRKDYVWTYIVDETNTLYRKKLPWPHITPCFPSDPVADGWELNP